LLALAIVVAVAIIVKVDKIVPAKGRLDTKAELFEVRNTQQGFVSKVFFEEGEKVNAGDLLVKFDTRLLELDIQSLDQDIKALGRNLWSDAYQLNKVLSAADYKSIAVLLNQVHDPFSQLSWTHALVAPLEQTLAQLHLSQLDARQQAQHTQGQLSLAGQSLAMDEIELTRAQKLYQKGIESQAQMEQKQHQQARLFLTQDKAPYGFASWVAVPRTMHLQLLQAATWEKLQPEVDELLHQVTKPSSKNEPTYLWFVDLLTPFSHALAATQELKHHLSIHTQAWALNINQGQCVPRQVW